MPFKQTDIEQDDIALGCLSGCEFKAYRFLVNRADPIGICYPKLDTIAAAIDYGVREVQRALEVLNDNDVFRYRRKNAFNPVTRRKEVNVYQVSPLLLVIAPEFEVEAWSEWDALINQCGNVSTGLWSHNNNNQGTKNKNYIQEIDSGNNTTKSASKAKGGDSAADDANQQTGGKKQKQNPDAETTTRKARDDRHGDVPKSSVPPERPQYANPESINSNLPDAAHEGLASDLRRFGIAMALARGFVVTYGYSRTKLAYDQVVKMGENARQPAAVFRSIVQVRLADDFALAQQQIFGNRKQS